MSTGFRLNLPTDIPWRRLCVSEDMLDRAVCDNTLPPKWQSSIAVFKYVPDEDYQLHPGLRISYLKVTATITGYQAPENEIQGQIDWDGVDVSTIDGVTELLNSYFPCTGAILQVAVGPRPPSRASAAAMAAQAEPDFDDYPFFLDFEPKKRELYEMATDTKERQSRSMETLQLGKSGGSTQSLEILDVDMGGSTSVGAEASFAGTGGGFDYASSSQGQWGTKSLNTQQSQTSRVTEAGQEKRETYSYTTQLSQMYHLLDSYHVGTNRAVFFMQPRPHVLEEPSGFVRGPRKVEGIQEFFLVVAQPTDDDYCVSVRLDTGHLAETPILDYEHRTDVTDLASATASVPTRNDIPDGTTTREACFAWECWDVIYHCFRTFDADDVIYTAPTGFTVTSITSLVNDSHNGSTSATVNPGGKTVTVHAEAGGHICFEHSGACVDCPDEVERRSGYARRQEEVTLRSDEPTREIGKRQHLLVTTRAVCCCPEVAVLDPGIIGTVPIPGNMGGEYYYDRPAAAGTARRAAGTDTAAVPRSAAKTREHDDAASAPCEDCAQDAATARTDRRMTIRQANDMVDFMRSRMVNMVSKPGAVENTHTFAESEVFIRSMHAVARRTRAGREALRRPVGDGIPREVAVAVAKRVNKAPEEVTADDVLGTRDIELTRAAGLDARAIARLRLHALGIAREAGGDGGGPNGPKGGGPNGPKGGGPNEPEGGDPDAGKGGGAKGPRDGGPKGADMDDGGEPRRAEPEEAENAAPAATRDQKRGRGPNTG